MSNVLDEFNIFKKKCATTAFDQKLAVRKDGRERGLWFWIEDESREHAKARYEFLQMHGTTTLGDVTFPNLYRYQISEAGLIEWKDLEKLHKAMGKELAKARKRGDL